MRRSAGRGAIIMTPHLGSWEMVGLYCSSLHTLTSLPPAARGTDDHAQRP